jgi:hypothetical protein
MDIIGFYDANGNPMEVRTAEGLPSTLATLLDKNDQVTNIPIGCEWLEVNLATATPVVLCAVPCVFLGFYVGVVMSAHAVTIGDDVTVKQTMPASLAAGVQFTPPPLKCLTNLTITPNASSTGKVTFMWRVL